MDASEQYEIVIVNYGRRQTVKSEVFLNYGLYGEPDEPIGMDYFFWVVRNERFTVVVDTGFSRAGGDARRRDTLIAPIDALAALGIRPEDAPLIVVTHAHYDHIGNLGAFDRSPIVIADAELAFWTGSMRKRPLFHHSVEEAELDALAAAVIQGRVSTFNERLELAPGIEVSRVGGHTPGQSVVAVATSRGVVLLASDAVHYFEELTADRPFSHVADVAGTYAAFDRIRQMLDTGEIVEVVSGHDPSSRNQGDAITEGPLRGFASTIAAIPDLAGLRS